MDIFLDYCTLTGMLHAKFKLSITCSFSRKTLLWDIHACVKTVLRKMFMKIFRNEMKIMPQNSIFHNRNPPIINEKKNKHHFCYVFTLHICPYDMAIDIMNKKSAVVVINSSIKTTKPYFWQKWNNVILLITWKIYRKMVLKKKGRIVLFHGLVYLYTLSFTPHNWTFLEKIKY